MNGYDFKKIEERWQKEWAGRKVFEAQSGGPKEKFYSLEMLPYPSGQLHMGHVRNYSIGDVVARYKRRRGYNVLHPIGWDALGLPAENAAMKHKVQPYDWTWKNIRAMRSQFGRLGVSFDWSREIATCEPEYYKWNQWFFIRLFERGLAYRKKGVVNWCPSCQTVLANEQVIAGRCWRCDSEVTVRKLDQWYFKITEYAERLLQGLEKLTEWPEKVVTMQRNWIGKSEGAYVDFPIENSDKKITVFTTRIDTIYGATFAVLSPEHPLLSEIWKDTHPELIQQAASLREEQILHGKEDLEKKGFFAEFHAINPFNNQRIPVWVANYVLMEYGTGAIMAVPAHDIRDGEFATKYKIPMQLVIEREDGSQAIEEYGKVVHSGEYSGLSSEEAQKRMISRAEQNNFGKGATTYKIKDWGISRQRYWGTPIPMIHCDRCGIVPVPDDQLPVKLPRHIQITGEKGSPLAHVPEFVNVACPRCGGPARRDTDTMDTFVDSSWYFFRYCSPHEDNAMFDKKEVNYWMPIDLYIGGVEHAILHLIYCRFFTKLFYDMGMIGFDEPVKRLFTQGMVIKDGAKMSKSKGNVVEPDELIEKYGADTARLFCLFAAPPEKELEWSDQGVEGCHRFLNRVWKLVSQNLDKIRALDTGSRQTTNEADRKLLRKTHQTIRKVTQDIDERMHHNTAISAIMELVNLTTELSLDSSNPAASGAALRESLQAVVSLLNPFAPHISEELWLILGKETLLADQSWPEFDPDLAREEEATVVIQVNGKLRGSVQTPHGANQDQIFLQASQDERISKHLENKQVRKIIFVPDRLINIVVE
jgi:leucyl-tRNA synthetase